MIKVMPESEGKVLMVKAEGKLTDADYKEVFIPRMEHLLGDYGKVRVLMDMGEEFEGWDREAFWDDARFGLDHRNDFEKIAVVGGPKWIDWGMKISSLFMSGEIKCFPSDKREEAMAWIKT